MDYEEFTKKYYIDRKNTKSTKWDNMLNRFGRDDMVPMWIADTDFSAPEEAVEAVKRRAEHGAYGYTITALSYYQALQYWQRSRHGLEIEQDWIRFSPGCVAGIYWCIQALTKENDAILVNTPVFYPFVLMPGNSKRTLVCNELINDNGKYSIDYEDFEAKIRDNDVKLYVLCSPHNPAGRVWKEEELERVLEICDRYHVIVIADEIHADFVFGDNKFIPAFNVAGGKYRESMITITGPSKTFNLAGLKNSHLLIPSESYRKAYDDYMVYLHMDNGCLFGYEAAEAAYLHGAEYVDGLLQTVYKNYEYTYSAFKENLPNVVIPPLEGTYLSWFDLSPYIDPDDLQEVIQNRAGVALDYGKWYGEHFAGYIRLNLGTSLENVKKAVDAIIRECINYIHEKG